jgi:glycosyltransferase involved in cell wall biosynthesis
MAATASRPAGLRHCMVVYAYYPLGETRVQREAEILAKAGYAVDVICLRAYGELPRERYRGVEVHRLPLRRDKRNLAFQLLSYLRFMLRASARLTKLHLDHPYRTVQVHNLPDFLVFCAIVPKIKRVPIILDLHDLMPEFFAGRFGSGRKGLAARMIRWQERAACRFADHVITVSDHWRTALVQRRVSPDKVSVIMNVADQSIFRPRAPRPRGPEFCLIYHGTVTYRYGLDLALRAVAIVRDEIPSIRLTIVGNGDQMQRLFDLRRALRLENFVELRDKLVLVEELPQVIGAADVGIVPYRNDVFTDGLLPTKLMEYAAMRIPSIAARTTAIDAYFRNTMVEFFEPDDAIDLARCIRRLHEDPEHLAALAERSENFLRRHDWATIGERYVDLVSSLPDTRGPLGPESDSRGDMPEQQGITRRGVQRQFIHGRSRLE